jgi:hypothetical protein
MNLTMGDIAGIAVFVFLFFVIPVAFTQRLSRVFMRPWRDIRDMYRCLHGNHLPEYGDCAPISSAIRFSITGKLLFVNRCHRCRATYEERADG